MDKVLVCHFQKLKQGESQSCTSLLESIEKLISKNDILLTLPTSKDQLIYKEIKHAGYTEFFRYYYNDPAIAMEFHSPKERFLLITDHIPLSSVSNFITPDLIIKKISNSISGNLKYFHPVTKVLISGINPHAGESGILGHEDSVISQAISFLKEKFLDIDFIGPISGDTLHMYCEEKNESSTLKVYMAHDQGLALFKDKYGLMGTNISFGLPFLRMSVDHGTAFSLYGKNSANYAGCLFALSEAVRVHKRL